METLYYKKILKYKLALLHFNIFYVFYEKNFMNFMKIEKLNKSQKMDLVAGVSLDLNTNVGCVAVRVQRSRGLV